MKNWTARDWRQVIGVMALAGGGVSVTVLAGFALQILAEKSVTPWPAAYFGFGCLILIGIVLTGFSAILGRRTFKFRVGDNEIEATGQSAEDVMESVDG